MVLRETDGKDVRELLKEHKVLEHREIGLPNGEVLVRILLEVEQSQVLDLLEKWFVGGRGNRVVILPVEATLPRVELESATTAEQPASDETLPERISRDELYEDIKAGARCSWIYLAMVSLSTIVVAIGPHLSSVAIVIGALVIASLLAPNAALATGTTLGDLSLLRHALLTSLAGIAAAVALSIILGALLHVAPASSEVTSRTRLRPGDIAAALASGCTSVRAFTMGVSTTLISVMEAVALLPPLLTFWLLLDDNQAEPAIRALSLFLVNLVCVTLAGIATFLVQGIRSDELVAERSRREIHARRHRLWVATLVVLSRTILLVRKG